MRLDPVFVLIVLSALGLSSSATAATAISAPGNTNMRNGPGTHYTIIGSVHGGSRVELIGCLEDYSWCKGTVQGVEGWISASRLEGLHAQRTGDSVPIINYGRQGGRILGQVTDRPGYCYALDGSGNSIVVRCEGGANDEPPPVSGRILGKVTDRPGYCYALDAGGNSVVVPCP
jgi:hypothetical protein